MKYNSIKAQVWRLILIPALSVSLMLAGTLTYLYVKQLNKFVSHRGGMLTQKMAHLSHYALRSGDENMVPSILEASLEEPFIRAIHLYHHETGQHFHVGPQFMEITHGNTPTMEQPSTRITVKSILFSHPVVDNKGKNPIGWVEMELLNSPFLVLRYETLLISVLITVLCLILAAWLAIRLHQNITIPLSHIKSVVRKLAKGKLHSRVDTQHGQEFLELAETVNAMALSMEKAQQDMQAYIDQSTEDLRETLETIEIQNIDLDIARKEALEASRIKSEFLANTSHEIRTPLNGILGFTNLALKTDLDEQQREYLNTIRDSSQHLLTVINSILDFSKIEAGKLTLDYVPLPLRRSIDEAIHILAPDAHEKNLQIITYIDPEIPANLLGDPLRFKQVITNLVSNAIKFSNKGNIIVDVVLLTRQESQATIKVTVSDEGIGLARSQKDSLFNAFAQVDTSSAREHGGTGLGLAISKGLVERMGGDIGVESEPEKGSSFWFTARLGIDKKQPTTNFKPNFNKRKILVCGENSASAAQINRLLQEWDTDTQVISAVHDIFPTLRQARDAGQSFDVVILDIAPAERKIQPILLHNLTEQLTEEFNCKVIACCTAAHQRLLRNQADKLQTTFVNKPITYDSLLQTLGRQLNITVKDSRAQEAESEEHRNRPSASVLVVDDNPANLQLASELLRGLNTNVVQASSGKEALDICAKQHFDVIFMDIQMPGMDGIETTRRLRATETSGRRTPIIALTAHSMTEQKYELLVAGMDDCVSKPVSEAQLAHIVNRWVSQAGKKEVVVTPQELQNSITQPRMPAIADLTEDVTSVDILMSLRLANNKPTLARDMLVMLLQNLEAERTDINAAFEQEDFVKLEELVHRLYGSCCYCGVPRLKKISGLLDKLLQAKQYEQAPGAMVSLNKAIDDVLSWGHNRDINAIFSLDE